VNEIKELAKSLIDNYQINTVYRLNGFEVTGGNAWTSGALFYNGEIFLINGGSVAIGGGQTLILNIVTEFLPTDPVEYLPSGSGSFNTHQIRLMACVSGVSGSGVADVSNVKGILKTMVLEIGSWDMDSVETKFVDIPLFLKQIKSVDVLIFIDSLGFSQKIDYSDPVGWLPSGSLSLRHVIIGEKLTRCRLERRPGGYFDDNFFDNTEINRGFITVQYEL
jgi:hypothetical protein